MEQLKQPPEMDFAVSDVTNLPEKWRKWKHTAELYLSLAMPNKSEKEKCQAFLYIIGQQGRDIYETLNFSEDEKFKLEPMFEKFERYCKPKQNVSVERYKFNTLAQGTSTIDQYITNLRLIAKNCNYGDLEDEFLRDRIVCGVTSEVMRERLLREEELTLTKALKICRAVEEAKKHVKLMGEEPAVHEVNTRRKGKGNQRRKSSKSSQAGSTKPDTKESQEFTACGKCARKHAPRQCPAYGQECHQCGKRNHFSKCCRSGSKGIHSLSQGKSEVSSDEPMFIGAVDKESHNTEIQENECYTTLDVHGLNIRFKLDTGAQTNILPLTVFNQIPNTQLEKPSTTLTSYTGNKLAAIGECKLKCKGLDLEFFIVDTNKPPLLGFKACQDLNLIKVVMNVNNDSQVDVIQEFPKVFQGLGCLDKPYHIEIDPDVKPVVCPPKAQPVALRERLHTTLTQMEKDGVIRKVEQPTEWVNSLVAVEKPKTGQLRVCLDPRPLNKAVQREHFMLPTIEDITTRLAGATIFSKLDANHGYWQIPLDEESQLLTTFHSPFGRYCYVRLPFGVKSAQEVFQKRMSQHFGDLEGVETDIDDILVWGSSKKEHDERLRKVLQRCEEINLTLNKEKCEFGVKEVTYIGHKLSAKGVEPDAEKVRAIQDMPAPTDKKGVERLLGTINYLAKFIPNVSEVTAPIRELIRKDTVFTWSHTQQSAFNKIKSILSKSPVLTYYDVTKPVVVSCDASKSGLGAVLMQEDKPVAYASRALTDAETRYAQIEKELLAVVFAMERFNQYTYGKLVDVESDHKPLESILKKSLSSAPPRLQRMLLRLQKYDISLKYKPGKEMVVADTLSRAYLQDSNNDMEDEISTYVHTVMSSIPASDGKLEQIKTQTRSDETMQVLRRTIHDGWPEKRSHAPRQIQQFWNYRDELSEVDDILLKGERIIIPPALRPEMLAIIHTGHLGIERSKQRARDIMFWPGMNDDISKMVSSCNTCLEHRNSNAKEPMFDAPLPSRPWEMVATDLFEWNNDEYLVITDYYSRYVEVAKLEDQTSKTTIMHTKSVFARHGIPNVVRGDNGPQFKSQEYKKFSEEWGFTHVTTSPYHSQSNGLAEKSVQTIKSILDKSQAERKDPYLALLEHRNTPIDGIGSPAQISMSRRLRSVIPTTPDQLKPKLIDPEDIKQKLKAKQAQQKLHYDKGSKALPPLKKNELIRMQIQNRWLPATVVGEAGTPRSYNVLSPSGRVLRRNRRHLLKTGEGEEEKRNEVSDAAETFQNASSTTEDTLPTTDFTTDEPPNTEPNHEVMRTSSGRTVRKPSRFQDYVM